MAGRGRGGFDRGRGGGGFRGGPDRGGGRGGRGGGRGGPPGGGGGGRGGGFSGRDQGGIFAPQGVSSAIDDRLAGNSQDVLVQSFQSLSLKPQDLPVRPGFGIKGTPVKLRANYFPVRIPRSDIFEYEVVISPAAGTAARRVKRRIFQLAEQTNDWTTKGLRGFVAHDHAAKLIAAKQLVQPLTIDIVYFDEDEAGPNERSKKYRLTIKFIQALDMKHVHEYVQGNPQYRGYDILPLLSALNIVLAAYPNRSGPGGGVLVGRNRYFFPGAAPPVPLGGGLEAWRGFFTSVRPNFKSLMVNVNVCTTAFYTPSNLAHALETFLAASFGARANNFVMKLRVKTIHLGYRKTIKSIFPKTPREHTFFCDEYNTDITVEQYFKRKYKIVLKFPHLPLVDVGGQKANLLPPEICEILPNQAFKGKLSDEATAEMIKVAAKPPNINAAAITGPGLDSLGYRQQANPLSNFGISIGTEMTVVPGRILPPPGVQYSKGTPKVDDRASWNLRNVKFHIGARLSGPWAVLLIRDKGRDEFQSPKDTQLEGIVKGFIDMCNTSGTTITQRPTMVEAVIPQKSQREPIRADAIRAIREVIIKLPNKPKIILVVLSNGDKHVYNGIKHLCDVWLDIATVCVHSGKIRKGNPQYYANVALKFNKKLGGVNHILDAGSMAWFKKAKTMLVGVDVTHPGPGSVKGTPSIAAVVASMDDNFARYPASMELQESKKEMVTNMKNMMVERLLHYRDNNRTLPQRVLVYRDGVSEGQFSIVVEEELPEMKKAFATFDTPTAKYNPKLTIVICGKRHHTRFYPTDATGADHNGNPKAGTVVDRGVTAIYDFDFFLQAHGGLQGTTKPTHYYVVHDEIKFGADELQGLTNAVSYLFARTTKAVSLVSPAYYADICCERGRCYLHKLLQGITNVNLNAQNADALVMAEAVQAWRGGVQGSELKNTMYYL